jgi:Leucine-rich repeat (LRR) protein
MQRLIHSLSYVLLLAAISARSQEALPKCDATLTDTLKFLQGKGLKIADEKTLQATKLISLGGQRVEDTDLPLLCPLTWIHNLELYNDNSPKPLTGKNLEYLGYLTQLESLDLDSNHLHAASLIKLAPLKHLKNLRLYNNPLGGEGIEAVNELTSLETLYVHNSQIDDEALAHFEALADHPALRELILIGNPITDRGLTHLRKFTHLKRLILMGMELKTGDGLKDVAEMASLTVLDIGNNSLVSKRRNTLKGSNLTALTALKDLEYLGVAGLMLTDDDMITIGKIRSLKSIDLFGNKVTNKGLRALLNLDDLRCLAFYPKNISVDSVEFKELNAKFPKLEASPLQQGCNQ